MDKAFDTADKAQRLKADIRKKADEVKKDLTNKAGELNQQVQKGIGIPEKPSTDNGSKSGRAGGAS